MSTSASRSTDKYAQELHKLVRGAHLTVGINEVDLDLDEYLVQTIGNTYLIDAGSQHALDRGCKRLLFEISATPDAPAKRFGPFVNACSDSEPEGFDG